MCKKWARMGECVSSFPLKLGVGEEGNHPSNGQEIEFSGLEEEAIQSWNRIWAREA